MRLRSAQKAGQLDVNADVDLTLEMLYAPLFHGGCTAADR